MTLLFDYFDIHYQDRKNLYVLEDGELFLYINDEENHIIYGEKKEK